MEFLKPQQREHTERLFSIYEREGSSSLFACDFSVMGAGKTWPANVIPFEYGLGIVWLGPRGSLSHVKEVSEKVDSNLLMTITYESTRSVRGCQPKHGLLRRYDYDDGSVGFTVTKDYKRLVNEGIFLVLDECQKIKNNSDQTKAIRTLVREILDYGGKSRVLFLSGSPLEEPKHALNFFRTIGFISHPKMYTITKNHEFIPHGLQELIDHLGMYYPEDVADLVIKHTPFTKQSVSEFVFDCFTEIIVPYFSSAMPSPPLPFEKKVRNYYVRFDTEEEEQRYIDAVLGLQRAVAFNPENGTVNYTQDMQGQVGFWLRALEETKMPLFKKCSDKRLAKNPTGKVVVFVNHTDSINTLTETFSEFSPVIYDGRIRTQKKEAEAIDAFQTDPERRLFVANMRKGSLAINLQDTVGDSPRTTYMNPNFTITDMHQASQRTYRVGLKSDAKVCVIYGEVERDGVAILEARILNALARKTNNMKRVLIQQAREGVLFPGDYPEKHERPKEN